MKPCIFFFLFLATSAMAANPLVVGPFSQLNPADGFPPDWQPLTFEKIKTHTRYTPVTDPQWGTVIRAETAGGASGMVKKTEIDLATHPVLEWRWKVENVFAKGDVASKKGDDYPARIYVTFAYDPKELGFAERTRFQLAKLVYGEYPPIAAINYIWANKAPRGTMVPNAYTKRVMMIATDSGSSKTGTWVTNRVNVAKDYQRAFGKKPPKISGIAIMTDGDNTKGHTVAFYGDIRFLPSASD